MHDQIESAFGTITAPPDLIEKTKQAVLKSAPRAEKQNFKQILSFAACAFAATIVLLLGGMVYYSSSAYISIDVNPSIELELNRFGRVITALPLNQEATLILDKVDIINQSYEYAVDTILEEEFQEGYINDNAVVLVAVQSDDPSTQDRMLRQVEQSTKSRSGSATTKCIAVSAGTKDEAKTYGVSAGKYSAIKELQQVDPSATVEQYKNSTMSDIMGKAETGAQNTQAPSESPQATPETAVQESKAQSQNTGANGQQGTQSTQSPRPSDRPAATPIRPEASKEPIKAVPKDEIADNVHAGNADDSINKSEPDNGENAELPADKDTENDGQNTGDSGFTEVPSGGDSDNNTTNDGSADENTTETGGNSLGTDTGPSENDSEVGGLGGEEYAQNTVSGS